MSTTRPNPFFESIPFNENHLNWFDNNVLSKELVDVLAKTPVQQEQEFCYLSGVGTYLVRLSKILSQLAGNIAPADDSIRYAIRHRPCEGPETAAYLINKNHALEKICNILQSAAKECDQVWTESPQPPKAIALFFPSDSPSWYNSNLGISNASNLAYTTSVFSADDDEDDEQAVVEDDSEADVEEMEQYNQEQNEQEHRDDGYERALNTSDTTIVTCTSQSGITMTPSAREGPHLSALRRRGTGSYECPEGSQCKKGGVSPDGRMVLFTRNSEFRAHMLKHQKPYTCVIPGCTKKGFARPDQLERHRQTPKHRQKEVFIQGARGSSSVVTTGVLDWHHPLESSSRGAKESEPENRDIE